MTIMKILQLMLHRDRGYSVQIIPVEILCFGQIEHRVFGVPGDVAPDRKKWGQLKLGGGYGGVGLQQAQPGVWPRVRVQLWTTQ